MKSELSIYYALCKLSLQERAGGDERTSFRRPRDRQLRGDIFIDGVLAQEIWRMHHSISSAVAKLEEIAPGGGVTDWHDPEVIRAA
ncbi:hypothetical protein [Bradyrhizobium canariense]|uniref:hypothetical protein n=1 Tax=Bradyrhizobium canariense TaxID=255045 RepID=UPI001AEC83B5|nr:hypothetical protein [Bradyrhizobium canariense]